MKKLLVLILTVLIATGMGNVTCIKVCAEEITSSETERTIRDVLVDTAKEQKLQEVFFTDEKLPDDLQGYSIANKPVIKWLYGTYGGISESNASEMLTNIWTKEEFAQFFLWVCEENVYQAISYFPSTTQHREPEKLFKQYEASYAEMNNFVYAILCESETQIFCGNQYKVEDVVIYGWNNVTDPTCAVYFTDGGEFVRVCTGYYVGTYDDTNVTYIEYTWNDFVLYWNAYYEYRLSKAYGPNGEPLNGGAEPFQKFVDEIYPTWENVPAKVDNDTPQYRWMIWVGVGVLVCCVVAVVLVKKHKNAQKRQMTEIIE